MKILCIGDVFGRPGREALRTLLPQVIEEEKIDFVIVNGENASGGKGITDKVAEELFKSPIDVITAGNHIWEHKSLHPYFSSHPILRPFNTIEMLPGRGWMIKKSRGGIDVAVVCLQGEVFMDDKGAKVKNPFHALDEALPVIKDICRIVIVDFHAETTSEKRTLGWHLDGRVSALVGTHTHVQTSDEEVLPKGTAYITDLGMTGPHASVIGLAKELALKRFLKGDRKGYKVAEGDVRLEGAVLDIDESTGLARSISRLRRRLPK